jgi:hypothetical protein
LKWWRKGMPSQQDSSWAIYSSLWWIWVQIAQIHWSKRIFLNWPTRVTRSCSREKFLSREKTFCIPCSSIPILPENGHGRGVHHDLMNWHKRAGNWAAGEGIVVISPEMDLILPENRFILDKKTESIAESTSAERDGIWQDLSFSQSQSSLLIEIFRSGGYSQIPGKFMSMTGLITRFKFAPFYAILEDGLERMLEIMKSQEFTFFCKRWSFGEYSCWSSFDFTDSS